MSRWHLPDISAQAVSERRATSPRWAWFPPLPELSAHGAAFPKVEWISRDE
jgi:hypothetical protein